MANLVVKCGYIKPGGNAGFYVRYIATREGVELAPEVRDRQATQKQEALIARLLQDYPQAREMLEYEDYSNSKTVEKASEFITRALEDYAAADSGAQIYTTYIATRPRAERLGRHGLFGARDEEIDLEALQTKLNRHRGNVWTVIVSLRRGDAQRLGFDNAARWRDMLRTQAQTISENLKIPLSHLHWYAAFHNESHHPHVHMVVYSDDPAEGYLSEPAIRRVKSSLAKDIFAQDLLCAYERQTQYRDALRQTAKEAAAELAGQLRESGVQNTKAEAMLVELAHALQSASGRKLYAYLKPEVKELVDGIAAELAKDERISALYALWYEQRDTILKIYNKQAPERVPLQSCSAFRPIKNAIIAEALKLGKALEAGIPKSSPDGTQAELLPETAPWEDTDWIRAVAADADSSVPEEPRTEPVGMSAGSCSGGESRRSWWTDRYRQARKYRFAAAEEQPDFEKAFALMREECENGNGFAMYELGKMYLLGLGCEKNEAAAQAWFREAYQAFLSEEAVARKKDYLRYRIGKLFALGHGVEQDYRRAAEWYEKAERNPFAAYALGSLYRRGQGVAQDDAKAFALYTIAAGDEKNPNAYAAYELGRMFAGGVGTAPDKAASDEWYRKAYQGFLQIERSGFADDALYYRLGQMKLKGVGVEADIRQAKRYFEKAAGLGNSYAAYALGKLFLYGEGAERDMKKALEWLTKAAEYGNANAQALLSHINEQYAAAAGLSVLRLFHFAGKILQNRISGDRHEYASRTERKLRRRIAQKKQAHGLRLE